MKAKEMFEELGYKLVDDFYRDYDRRIKYKKEYETTIWAPKCDDEGNIIYDKNGNEILEEAPYIDEATIDFYCRSKEVGKNDYDFYALYITMDELKAINQQCKELGWLGEDNV